MAWALEQHAGPAELAVFDEAEVGDEQVVWLRSARGDPVEARTPQLPGFIAWLADEEWVASGGVESSSTRRAHPGRIA